jgi:hypothetical protein
MPAILGPSHVIGVVGRRGHLLNRARFPANANETMAYAKGNAPAVTERDPGGPLRDHGDRDTARTDPESREACKGRREVGGDGGHGARRGRRTESRRPSGSRKWICWLFFVTSLR